MRIHILSDLHNELRVYQPAPVDADLVVLAGDIDVGAAALDWAREAFRVPVLYVPGNHEYYDGHLERTRQAICAAGDERVRMLDFDMALVGGVRFLGVTGWSDYAATGDAVQARQVARQRMQDCRRIRCGDDERLADPEDFARLAKRARDWLRSNLARPFPGPTVVITHHAPSLRSIEGHPHAGTPLDASFVNDWEDLMGAGVQLWIHGHTHYAVDYRIGGTRVLSNPRGYAHEEVAFDPQCVLRLGSGRVEREG